jgi:hypothetical protein
MKRVFLIFLYALLLVAPTSEAGTIKTVSALFGHQFANLTDNQMTTLANEFNIIMTSQWKYDNLAANSNATLLKSINQNVLLFAHINSKFIKPTQIQYSQCNSNEDLFAHTVYPYTAEHRITAADGVSYLMDVSNIEWSDEILSWYRDLSADWDGIFLDVGGPYLFPQQINALPFSYTDPTYRNVMSRHQEYIKSHAGTTVLFNGIQNWYRFTGYSDDLDGGLIESFALGPNHPKVEHDWIESCINVFLSNTKKFCLAAPKNIDFFSIEERVFVLACYLLAMHKNSYYILFQNPQGSLAWYPEYHLDIGSPLTTPSQLADMLHVSGLYIRDFTKGKVVVNDSSSPKSFNLSQTYWELKFAGGSLIPEDGRYSGKILATEQAPGLMTVPAGSALILSSYDPSISSMEPPMGLRVK